MYKVLLNGKLLHETGVNSRYRLSSGSFTEEVNKVPSFSFATPVSNPVFAKDINDRTDIVEVVNTLTGETEFEGAVLTHSESMDRNGRLSKTVAAEGFLGYLCDSVQLYKTYKGARPIDFLNDMLYRHNAQVSSEKQIKLGVVDINESDYNASKTTAYRSTLEEIKVNLIDRLGGEIQIRRESDGLYLDYLERIGTEKTTPIRLADNLVSLNVDTDSTNIITRLIPLGCQLDEGASAQRLTIESVNGGAAYIDDEEAIKKFGIIVGKAEFDDITLPENLLEKGREYMKNNNRIRKAYEAEALDLSVNYRSRESIRCGNIYPFKNEIFGIDEKLRIMKRTVDIYKPYAPVLQIGDKAESITDIAVRQAKLLEYSLPEQKTSILSAARATASALIKSGFKGHVVANDEEICIMDTADKATASKVWRFNMGGFGFSKNGYNGDYETAITMDGAIVADFITAGILRGLEILNGDGTFHVMPNGKVVASAIEIKGGSININTQSENQDVITLTFAGNICNITPGMMRIISSHNQNGVIVSGTGITGYSYLGQGEGSASFQLVSENGNISTQGNVSANSLYYKNDSGEFVSVKSQFDQCREQIQNNYDDCWGQIQEIWKMIDFLTGGNGA